MVKRVYEVAVQDDRIVGLVDFGSGVQGCVDEWSDIDVAVILRDGDYPAFRQDWKNG
jgi:predicted nucleotidyltransferase